MEKSLKEFIESWIEVNGSDIAELEYFEKWFKFLGYKHIIWEFYDTTNDPKQNKRNNSFLEKNSLVFYNRKTLTTTAKKQSKNYLDKLRKEFIIITQFCTAPELTKWACQDQRIDFLLFKLADIHMLADKSTIRLLQEHNKFLEIDCSEFFNTKFKPIGLLRKTQKVIFECVKKQVPVLLSSRARTPLSLRTPRAVLGMANFLGIPQNYYLQVSQAALYERLARNKRRLQSNLFVGPEIWKL